ncbi:MAG: quinolinate synthase NadA [Candidatus Woesearchaeota archaeon]
MKKMIEEIKKLKKKRNAIILVHNYQWPEIYEVADILGDSLELARAASSTGAKVIVFCGVDFMAESAKILSPDKVVLHPEKAAICPMAQMVTPEKILEMKKKHPKAAVVSYVNTTAEVKAVTDFCCTSANAVKVVNAIDADEIIFTPDKNLASYVQANTKKKIYASSGYCYVHAKIRPEAIKGAKGNHPEAEVVVHPECCAEVVKMADAVCSTSQMIGYCAESKASSFIIATEMGMVNRLKREVPGKEFYSVGGMCVQMKKIRLESVKKALEEMKHEVKLSDDVISRARKSLDNMLSV